MYVRLGLVLLLAVFAQARVYHQAVFAKDQQFLLRKDAEARIINGKNAEKGQFPYQVGIYMDTRSFCGGSVIDKNWVLTAAHCVDNFKLYAVYLGALEITLPNEPGRIVQNSREAIRHENYNPRNLDNDLGLVKLPTAIEPNEQIAIIPLPPRSFNDKDFAGHPVRVSGWGKTSDQSNSITSKLNYVDLTVISNAKCREYYNAEFVSDKIVCATGPNGKSTCNGDSGGALVLLEERTNQTTHFAVVSFVSTAGCASGAPSGYDRVAKFLDWIHDKTGIPIQN